MDVDTEAWGVGGSACPRSQAEKNFFGEIRVEAYSSHARGREGPRGPRQTGIERDCWGLAFVGSVYP